MPACNPVICSQFHSCACHCWQVYRNLQYFVPMPGKNKKDKSGKQLRLELLKSISGAAVPGQLTALMGGSGAGKVTLLSAPACIKGWSWPSWEGEPSCREHGDM